MSSLISLAPADASAAAGTSPAISEVLMKLTPLAYSISEVCELSSIGRTTIYAAIKKGELTTRKAGRRTLITAEALQEWLENLPTSGNQSPKTAAASSGDSHE